MATKARSPVLSILDDLMADAAAPAPAPAAPVATPAPSAKAAAKVATERQIEVPNFQSQFRPMAAVADIERDPNQPREEFDDADLDDLAVSAKRFGILQPIVLRLTNGQAPFTKKFVLIAGERRWLAAQRAGLAEVPYFLRDDLQGNDIFLAQVIENANRKDLTDFELAKAIRKCLDADSSLKQKDIAHYMNRSKATVSKLLGMLDGGVIEYVREGLLRTSNDAAMFKTLSDDERQQVVEQARAENKPVDRAVFDALRDAKMKADAEANAATADPAAAGEKESESASMPGSKLATGLADVDVGGAGAAGESTPGEAGGEGGGLGDAGTLSKAQSVATAAPSSGESSSSALKTVNLKLKVEDVEFLVPHFVDKAVDKVELRIPADIAIAIIENLGGTVPDDVADYAAKIKEFLPS